MAAAHRRNATGFTLVELLVVLGIIGMLIAIAPPLFSALQPGLRLRSAAGGLADELRALRATAIINHREASLSLDLVTGQYQTDPGAALRGLPQGVALQFDGPRSEVKDAVIDIRFYPDGSSTGGRIGLSSGKTQRWVVTHWLSGKVTVDE